MNILAAFIFFTRLPFGNQGSTRRMFQACSTLLAANRLADGRHHGRHSLADRTDTARIPCLDYSHHRPPVCYGMPARRRVSGLSGWVRRRHHPRAYACHHERFPYRKLRSYRTDILFPIAVTDAQSASKFPLYPCLLRRLLVQVLRIPTH